MERIACVDLPALPLQLLLRREQSWRPHPVVVVQDDRPQGVVLWANVHARHLRVLPGMTFAAARSLAAKLRAAVVADDEIADAVAELHAGLCNFSPFVEPSRTEPGVFWLDPTGLVPLYGSLEQWAQSVHCDLQNRGFESGVVVGFHRYRTYSMARTRAGGRSWVVPDPHIETRLAASVPLCRLDVHPDLRDHLHVLGIRTLGEFLRLPATELRTRFGEEAAHLHAQASDRWAPIVPRKLVDPIGDELQFEPPDDNYSRLLFGLKGALHGLIDRLAKRGQAMSALHLKLELDHAPAHDEFIEPASPTLDVMMILELVRLRLEALTLPAPVEGLRVELEGLRATQKQLALFRTHQRRDLDAAGRALARIRAAMGPEAVTRAQLRAAHLPEASFEWEPIVSASFPRTCGIADEAAPPLVRRFLTRPIPLPPRPRHEPEAWLGRRGAIAQMHGPLRVSGGWWVRTVERDYYYAETQTGEILWIYFDRPRRRWFLQATID